MKTKTFFFISVMLLVIGLGKQMNAQAPANDGCGGAFVITPASTCISGTSQLTGDVSGATQTLAGCSGVADDDVWYTFTTTATVGQPYAIEVTPGGASFDAVFEVFSTSCGGTSIICVNSTGAGGMEVTTLCTLAPSTQYWVRVYDAGIGYPAITTFTICITTPPINDCCNGYNLPVNVTCINTAGNLANATPSGLTTTCGGSAPTNDVFYNFTATATTLAVTVTPCATMNPVIQVYATSCGGTSINCTNAGGNGVAENACLTGLTVGSTYFIRVYDFNGVSACTAFAICVHYCSSVSTTDLAASDAGITISPNPASSELRISNEGLRIESIHIYNVLGECVQSSLIGHQTSVSLDVSTLHNGIYFIQLEDEHQNLTNRKIVINN